MIRLGKTVLGAARNSRFGSLLMVLNTALAIWVLATGKDVSEGLLHLSISFLMSAMIFSDYINTRMKNGFKKIIDQQERYILELQYIASEALSLANVDVSIKNEVRAEAQRSESYVQAD